jgi:acyl transferase domain-containing protein
MSPPTEPGRVPVALLFAGQGSQHPRMAAGLYRTDDSFTAWMDEAFRLFGPDARGVRAEWLSQRPSTMYDDVTIAQPLLYAVGHALGCAVLDRGVTPVALLGHSVGEMVAATLAGVLDLAEGIRVMRARAVQFSSTNGGGMLAVAATVEEVADVLGDGVLGERVALAAVNARRQLLLAGPSAELSAAADALDRRGLVCRPVAARQAFHSSAVDGAVLASLPHWRAVSLRPPRTPLYSAYTGAVLDERDALDPAFWAWQAARTVWFARALDALLDDHPDCLLVEAGAGNSLTQLVRRHRAVARGRACVVPLLPDRCRGDEADRDSAAAVFRLLAERASAPVPAGARDV